MKISLLILGKSERIIAVATAAAQEAFPASTVALARSLEDAIVGPEATLPEILLIEDGNKEQITKAVETLDGQKLPRWAVVASGTSPLVAHAEAISASEWTNPLLARIFRTSLAVHLLRRDNERLKGDLLAVGIRFTHDLRTPVGGIITATEALDELQGAPKSGESLTRPIVESAQDLVKIINQLTLVAKAAGRSDQRQLFDMGVAAGRAMERCEVKVRKLGATVTRPSAWPQVWGDAVKTEAVWQSFLENALHHAGNAPKIELGYDQQGEEFKFWVRDNGAGVGAEKRRLLFYPFHRMHETNAVRGLGLPIVGKLVQLQGGRCGYESSPGGGACFFFTLPSISPA